VEDVPRLLVAADVVALKSLENDVARERGTVVSWIGDAKTIRSSKHARRSTTR
jgi:hypothetical protein